MCSMRHSFLFTPTIGHLQIVMSLSIIMSMLWSVYFAYQKMFELLWPFLILLILLLKCEDWSYMYICNILEYVKLTRFAMIQVLSYVEGEWMFSNFNFIRSRIHNRLIDHLNLCVRMHWQILFSMDAFPYDKAMHIWQYNNIWYVLNAWIFNLGPWGGH